MTREEVLAVLKAIATSGMSTNTEKLTALKLIAEIEAWI